MRILEVLTLLCVWRAPLPVSSHANMVWPPTWFDDRGEVGITPGMQCAFNAPCMWFSNYTFISGPPTLPEDMRSFQDMYIEGLGNYDWTKTNPWRSPGSATLYSPCGVGGGNPDGCPVGGPEGDCVGGGYSYRLCKVPEEGVVTEECFQQTPLDFNGDMQWVQYGEDGDRIEFVAHRTRTGTFPAGSQWTRK